jgi:hypothetical protein
METDDGVIDGNATPTLSGTWFVYNDLPGDTSTTQNPVSSGKLIPTAFSQVTHSLTGETSSFAMRTWGTVGYSSGNGYAGIGCNLNGGKASYNASAYTGLMFYAHVGSGAGVATNVRLNIPLKTTTATADGGSCTTGCGDHYGRNIAGLTTSWQSFTVTWTPTNQLHQSSFGTSVPWDASQVYGIDFQMPAGTTSGPTTYDVWIDDIYFTK